MTIMDMLGQSVNLTVLGMGVVFGFLIIMVIAVTLMGKIIHSMGLDKEVPKPFTPSTGTAAKSTAVAAVIGAAIAEYQKNEEGVKHA
jgi:oxaloacetate decarboxylase gamma subunit